MANVLLTMNLSDVYGPQAAIIAKSLEEAGWRGDSSILGVFTRDFGKDASTAQAAAETIRNVDAAVFVGDQNGIASVFLVSGETPHAHVSPGP